jgi:Leucine-rich repeat (LRR) protein
MEEAAGARLLQTFLGCRLSDLDDQTKAALRRTSKHFKATVDATVLSCVINPDDLHDLLDCSWPNITTLGIKPKKGRTPSPRAFKTLLFALVSKFPLLSRLSLHNCTTLEALPTNIGAVSHLKEFIMSNCTGFKAFLPSFGQLTTLETLQICHCPALTLEGLAPLKYLQQLRWLKIDGKPVDDPRFPEWLCNNVTTSLQYLYLGEELRSWPSSLGNFKDLTTLVLINIAFNEVPESICSLHKLQKLDITNCGGSTHFYNLPTSLSKLTALEKLCLSTDMDGIGPLQHLTGLKCLFLDTSYVEIMEYPSFIWNLTSLTALELYNISLVELPAEIGQLKELKFLRFDIHCQALPEALGDLCALTELRMWNRDVQRLP